MKNLKPGSKLYKKLVCKCQQNTWLKIGGAMFEEDAYAEFDYQYCFTECANEIELIDTLCKGNWAIRQGFYYKNLFFVNQINGGSEWWTLKMFMGKLISFESITFYAKRSPAYNLKEYMDLIRRLLKATKKQCQKLKY